MQYTRIQNITDNRTLMLHRLLYAAVYCANLLLYACGAGVQGVGIII